MQYVHCPKIYLIIALLVTGCVFASTEVLNPTPTNSEVEVKASPTATTTTVIVEDQVEVVSEIPAFVVELGIPFELGSGETVRLGDSNFDLTFEAIIQDGRCPVGGTCVWEGEAEVQFLLSSSNTANTVFTLKILGLVETPYFDNPFVEQAGAGLRPRVQPARRHVPGAVDDDARGARRR